MQSVPERFRCSAIAVLENVWPRSLLRQIRFETIAFILFSRAKWTVPRAFRGKRHLRVNVGCGANTRPGFVNLDLLRHPEVIHWDCRKSLPFEDKSCSFIFAEHVLEHFEYPIESDRFLNECWRCLEPGGVVRIVVPDGGMYLRNYNNSWDVYVKARPLVESEGQYFDPWIHQTYNTKMEFINAIFRQGGEHKFIYDSDTLVEQIAKHGMRPVVKSYGASDLVCDLIDQESRSGESLYIEGIKQ